MMEDVREVRDYLTTIVQEKGISDIILSYKKSIEWDEFIHNRFNGDWLEIAKHQKLSKDFMEKFHDKLDWVEMSYYQNLSEDLISKFHDKVDWSFISCRQKLSEDFIEKFCDKISWWGVSAYQKLSEDFIIKFHDKIDWHQISIQHQKLSEDFLCKFEDEISWTPILLCDKPRKVNSRLMTKFYNIINMYDGDWEKISKCGILSDCFMIVFQDNINWDVIIEYQDVCIVFLEELFPERTFPEQEEY